MARASRIGDSRHCHLDNQCYPLQYIISVSSGCDQKQLKRVEVYFGPWFQSTQFITVTGGGSGGSACSGRPGHRGISCQQAQVLFSHSCSINDKNWASRGRGDSLVGKVLAT